MERAIGKFMGGEIASFVAKKFGSDFEGLKKSIEYLFSWEKDFRMEVEGYTILSSGLCPVKRFYPNYCEKGCVAFAEKFAEYFNATAERLSTDPCTFRFTLKEHAGKG